MQHTASAVAIRIDFLSDCIRMVPEDEGGVPWAGLLSSDENVNSPKHIEGANVGATGVFVKEFSGRFRLVWCPEADL